MTTLTAAELTATELSGHAGSNASDARAYRRASAELADTGPRWFRIGVVDVMVRSEIPGVLADYRELYRGFEQRELSDALDLRVCRERSHLTLGRRFVIRGAGRRVFAVKRSDEVLPFLECAVNWQVSKELNQYLQVHAGVVARRGVGFILPGKPGAGKTTLTAALLARGWQYLSDEFALIEPETGLLHPFPRALCIKKGSFEVIERLGLPLCGKPRYRKGAKGMVAYLSPTDLGSDALGRVCPLRYVVFPQYEHGVQPKLTPMSRGQAAFLMNQQSFNFDRYGSAGLDVLTEAVRGARCYQLVSSEPEATCDLMDRLAQDRHD